MVVFDAGILIKLLDPRTSDEEREKLEHLVANLQKDRVKILIPTPALSEFYVKADPSVLNALRDKSAFQVAPFDEKSAIECAISVRSAKESGNKKGAQKDVPWAKVKFDHQIVAIAKANSAQKIYSEDRGLRLFAKACGIDADSVDDLPRDPAAAQQKLDLIVTESAPSKSS
jgi:predicted nucleic acid-binding protein